MTLFNSDSWKRAASVYANAADIVSDCALVIPDIGDMGPGACTSVTTLIDEAVNAIVPASAQAVGANVKAIADQILQDALGLYATGQLYHDVELDNTLASKDIDEALAETPFN